MEAQQPDGKGGSGVPVAGNAGRAALGFAIGGSDSGSAAGLFEGLARRVVPSATWA